MACLSMDLGVEMKFFFFFFYFKVGNDEICVMHLNDFVLAPLKPGVTNIND